MEFNVYCDESCHLEHDDSPVMVLGAVYLPKEKIDEVTKRIKEIKKRNGISEHTEIKWIKISPACINMYMDIIDYFFDDDDLQFRCIVASKKNLNHHAFNQNHDAWYYKMYFDMLKVILSPRHSYNIYLDIKDTHSHKRCEKLNDVLCNNAYDFEREIIKKVNPIRSDEVQIMQITDILTGAICMVNRFTKDEIKSNAKLSIAKRIMERSGYSLRSTTLYREHKLNIFIWKGKEL